MNILRGLMAQKSITNTEDEILAENWMIDYFRRLPYFQNYPELCGSFPIPDDPLRRNTVWALVKSKETAEDHFLPTVVFMGHHDVVSADVYGDAEPWAFDPDEITKHLSRESLSAEANTELLSGEWIFGRGSCDMLGGTAAQMALLAEMAENALEGDDASESKKEISSSETGAESQAEEIKAIRGALLFVSVPDEESFSVGMRGTLPLLEKIKEEHHLDYRLAVCAEPNRRTDDGKTQVVSAGSIGKLLPVVLVQGKLVQIGSYREGLNPLGILSRIVAATEGDESFTERFEDELSVPPVWMYVRDLKDGYDFSLPRRAAGYCNVLTFHKTPARVLAYFLGKIKAAVTDASQPVAVKTWVTLWQQAKQRDGFADFSKEIMEQAAVLLKEQHKTFPEVTLWLMQRTLDFVQADEPLVLLGFAPPYYPAVRSEELDHEQRFSKYIKALARWNDIRIEPYFTGVSDCSYCGLPEGEKSPVYQANTPLWGELYQFDMAALERLRIPFLLLGPWGKDLHQVGERVNRYSLTQEYPEMLKKLLRFVWLSD